MNINSLLAKHQTLAVFAAVAAFLLSAFCFGQFMVTLLVIILFSKRVNFMVCFQYRNPLHRGSRLLGIDCDVPMGRMHARSPITARSRDKH